MIAVKRLKAHGCRKKFHHFPVTNIKYIRDIEFCVHEMINLRNFEIIEAERIKTVNPYIIIMI